MAFTDWTGQPAGPPALQVLGDLIEQKGGRLADAALAGLVRTRQRMRVRGY